MFPLRIEGLPNEQIPFFTILIIIANAAVFFYEVSLGPALEIFVRELGLLPVEITQGQNLPGSEGIPPYLTLVTSMFLHGGVLHLLGNMWFLWIFGDHIEESLGHLRFLLFYFLTGICAGLTQVFLMPLSRVPTIGASGAISGVLGATLILHPGARVKTLFSLGFFLRVGYVPAIFFLGIWFLFQLLGGVDTNQAAGVAFGAHIGGFISGAVLIPFFRIGRPPSQYRRPW